MGLRTRELRPVVGNPSVERSQVIRLHAHPDQCALICRRWPPTLVDDRAAAVGGLFCYPCCARIASARSTGALQIVRWRRIGADTPNPHQALARLAYPSYLAPPAQRDHRTHAIARKERDATAKQQQKRLIHISPPSLSHSWQGGGVSICTALITTEASQCAPQ
jgi:hypothetical protein